MKSKLFVLMMCSGLVCVGSVHAMWRAGVAGIMAGVSRAYTLKHVMTTGQRSFAAVKSSDFAPVLGSRDGRSNELLHSVRQQSGDSMSKCEYQGSVVDACWSVLRACQEQKATEASNALGMLQSALIKDINANAMDRWGKSGLHVLGIALATCPKNEAMAQAVQLLLEAQADVTSVLFDDGDTLLHKAAEGGNVTVMAALVDAGLDVNVRNKLGRTPLHTAAACARSRKSWDGLDISPGIKKLCELGAHLEATTDGKETPLRLARTKQAIKMLVECKADIEAVSDNGNTPLIWAATDSDYVRVKTLLDCGAKIDTRNKEGLTALEVVQNKCKVIHDREGEAIIKLLWYETL